ncbi:aminotransferase class I/II-fold pyridoxal phosphate-dependent enzyme [Zobellia amurskyensis]|uniref:Aminotransferase class I/II-fold pyridoxal phosphate-dependent enzyme n=1 Tax=Zobellia amurskyensis TaxID=248905 RepID=A0A7X2ZWB0_9FLAO|nr:aminotransferase class I/II-fold pyridoxal phosphate-dependent enzyme [Zobellia amurskyensis]MUH37567.1 aminotransferase class I/II-fold pyridoxal phosphate-dependent enzyme [Zobellia amurskyensis]
MTNNQRLTEVYDAEQFRAIGKELIDVLANHLGNLQSQETKTVYPNNAPEDELQFWENDFKQHSDPIQTLTTLLNRSQQTQHPKYMGHQTAVPAPISALTGLVTDLVNNSTGVYEMGPVSNAMERVVTDFTAKKIGYGEQASGLMTSGGSLANLTALLAARKDKAPQNVWEEGHNEKLAVLVSEEAHYCIDRAARILGLGDNGIIKVPVDENFKIRTDLLPHYLKKAKEKGLHVFCIIGCAGSTATGSYDDLEALAKFSTENNIWLHVDGAHGGAVVFSEKYKRLTQGMEKADSVVIDFHKMLMTPVLSTALLFKQGNKIYRTFAQRAQYLWDSPETEEWYNSAKRTFECSKPFLSAKVYLILKTHGSDIFEKNVDQLYDSAQLLSQLIQAKPEFELVHEPQSNIVNFRYIPNANMNGAELNELNGQIRKQLIASGKFYIVQTTINNKRTLRCSIMNPLTSKNDFLELLDEIEKLAFSIRGTASVLA